MSERVGTSAHTVGSAGCLVCCVASLLADYGVRGGRGAEAPTTNPGPITPAELNRWLVEQQGYVDDCLLEFAAVEPLGVKLSGWLDCWQYPAPMGQVASALAGKASVLALVDSKPGGPVQDHWVRLLAVGTKDATIMDPWQPAGQETVSLLKFYGGAGWDAARAIFLLATYGRPDVAVRGVNYGVARRRGLVQPGLSLWGGG